nr:DUF2158 domain-containing protein [Thalassococcus arenae]
MVVRLKSGGPAMVVETELAPGVVTCVWFQDGRKFNTFFRTETLMAVNETSGEKQRVQ